MGKKSLGRGLEHISEVFLSSEANGQNDNPSDAKKKEPESVQHRSPPEKGQIVSIDQHEQRIGNEKTEKHVHPPYSDFFLDENLEEAGETFSFGPEGLPEDADLMDAMCEVEEKITIERTISYPDSPDAQQKLIHLLCRHLKDGYAIRRIELVRLEKNRKPGRSDEKEEVITINVNEPPPAAGL